MEKLDSMYHDPPYPLRVTTCTDFGFSLGRLILFVAAILWHRSRNGSIMELAVDETTSTTNVDPHYFIWAISVCQPFLSLYV